MPPIENTPGDDAHEARHEKNLAALFEDDAGTEQSETEDSEQSDETSDNSEDISEENSSEDADSEQEEVSEEEDTEEDYEAPLKSKKTDEGDGEPDEEPKNESIARKMAKENGRRAKQAEAKVTELELEVERLRTDLQARETRLQEVESLQLNPFDYPEVKQVRDKVMANVKRGAAMLGARNPQVFRDKFGDYIQTFMDSESLDDAELDTAIASLRKQIIREVGGFEDEYEDLDFTEQAKADAIADRALQVIERAVPDTRKAIELAGNLKSRAKVSQLAVGTREYEQAVAEFQPVLDAIGDLPEDAVAADPHSVPAVVARMVKDSPEAKRRVEKAKQDVLEILIGPRALSPEEIAKLEANGTDLKSFYAERQKAVAAKRKKLLPLIVQGLATRAIFADTLKKLAKYETDRIEEEEEFDALEGVRKKKPIPAKKKPAQTGPRKNSVLAEMFGDHYDEL